MRFLCIALPALVAPFLAQLPAPASIQGVAIVAGNEDPVPGAVIELRPSGGVAEPMFAATQTNGAFLFRSLPAGRYIVLASRNGYLPAEMGQRSPAGRGTPIMVAAGQQVTGLRVAMTPTAAISGRISDASGQPMPGVVVQLLRPVFQDGRRSLATLKSMLTNDLGEYRIFWVQPGSYYVNVIPPPDTPAGGGINLVINPTGPPTGRSLWSNQSNVAIRPPGSGLKETEAYLPTFFPGTAVEGEATAIELQPGADVRGIDIRVTPVRAWRLHGLVLNGSTGQLAPRATLQLISMLNGRVLQTTSDAMGVYTIPRVPAGSYVLAATLPSAGAGRLMNVEMRDADIEATVELQPFYSLSGKIHATNPAAFGVRLRLDYPIPNPPQLNVTPAADGSFTFRTVPPGDYRVFVSPILLPQAPTPPPVPDLLRTTYVKTMRMGDADLLNSALRMDQPPQSTVEITLATDPGSLAGRVLNQRQQPAVAVTVVLLPEVEQRSFRTDLYRVTTTDESGRFLLESVPPGDYRVFAWENVADREWQDPDFMRRYEDMGRPVRITEDARQSVELTAVP